MASNYPASLDAFTTGTLTGTVVGSDHGNKADAINKIEAELGTAPSAAQASVKARIDSLCVNVKDHGALGDGSTNDRTAIQAAIDSLPVGGGTVFFPAGTYNCSTALDCDDTTSVVLRGVGGVTGGISQASRITYTGTGSGSFLSARSSFGFKLMDLAVTYTSTSFTGTLVDLSQSAALTDTQMAIFNECAIGSGSTTIRSATRLILLDKAICCTFNNCIIYGGVVGVLGRTASGNYSNAHRFSGCQFSYMNTMAVSNPGQAWTFFGCTFQQLYTSGVSAGAGACKSDSSYNSGGLVFEGCWFGDATAVGNWIEFRGSGLSVVGNYLTTGSKGVVVAGSSNFGISISGNEFVSLGTGVDLGTGQARCVVMGNQYSTVTTNIAVGDNPTGSMLEYVLGTINSVYVPGDSFISGFQSFAEMGTPPTGANTNQGRLFARDNGSGKTQLCVVFQSGAVQVLATEP